MQSQANRDQITALYAEGWELLFFNMDKAVQCFEKAKALSLMGNENELLAIAIYKANMSVVHYQRSSIETALQYCMEALAVFEEHPGHDGEICISNYILGKTYWDLGVRDKGINYLIKGYELSKASGIKIEEARGLFFLATCYLDIEEYESALSYITEADLILEARNPSFLKARCKISLGCIYRELGDYPKAFHYLDSGAELCRILKSPAILARAYNDLAKTYTLQQASQKALDYYMQSLEIRKELNAKQGIVSTQLDLSKLYMDNNQLDLAIMVIQEALELATSINAKSKIQRAYQLLAAIYESNGETNQAFECFKEYHRIKNEVDHSEAEAKLNNIHLSHKAEQAENESKFMKVKNKELAEINYRLEETNIALDHEKQRSERLLLNILPNSIAQRLKDGEKLIADSFQEVTVLFADIVGFTQLSAKLTPTELIQFLNGVFLCFDELTSRHQLEKIKTIGDAYLVVSGIPQKVDDPNRRMADLALDMVRAFKLISQSMPHPVGIRIGIHCGSAVAGVIGSSKFSYDIWGDTVNLASRMESHSENGQIHVTEAIYLALKDRYLFEGRGPITIKGKGEMNTYYLLQE